MTVEGLQEWYDEACLIVYNNKYQDGVQWHDVPCFSRSAQYQTTYNVFDDGVQFLILEEVPKSLYMDTAFCKWSFLKELSALKNVCLQRSQLTGSIKEKVLVGVYQTLRTCLLNNTVLYLHCMTACVQGPHHLRGLRAADGEGPGGERGGCVRTTLRLVSKKCKTILYTLFQIFIIYLSDC